MKDIKQLQELGWTIPGAINKYVEARHILEFLRKTGYLKQFVGRPSNCLRLCAGEV